jgi:hypothetical protein
MPTEMNLHLHKRDEKEKPYLLWETAGYRAVLDGSDLHFEQKAPDRLGVFRWEECEAEYAIRSYFAGMAKTFENAFKGL